MKDLKYNIPFEVNEKQYNAIMHELSGVCAGQIKEGKYFLKVWLTRYNNHVQILLNKHK